MNVKKLNIKIETIKQSKICKQCNNVGYYNDKKGILRLCLKCLAKGKLDQDNIQLNKGGNK